MFEKLKFHHFSRVQVFRFSFRTKYRGPRSLSSNLDHSVPVPDTFHWNTNWNHIASSSVGFLKTILSRKHHSFPASDISVTRTVGGLWHKDQKADSADEDFEGLKRLTKVWRANSTRRQQTMFCIVLSVGDVQDRVWVLFSWQHRCSPCSHVTIIQAWPALSPCAWYPGHSQALCLYWHLLTSPHASGDADL